MSVSRISSVNNVIFKGGESLEPRNTEIKSRQEIKDGKKKLAMALGALAIIGIGAVAIAYSKKVPSELSIEEFKKIGKFDKGVAKAKGKLYTGIINAPVKDGSVALEYEKGILKQSIKYKTTEIPGTEPFLLPNVKKVYSTGQDGTKTVETLLYNIDHKTFGGKEWVQIDTTTVADGKVVVEHVDGLTGDKLQDVTVKQQDGSWFKTTQEIDYDFDTAGARHILTKNAKTGEILKDEVRTFEMPSGAGPKKPASEAEKRVFTL